MRIHVRFVKMQSTDYNHSSDNPLVATKYH